MINVKQMGAIIKEVVRIIQSLFGLIGVVIGGLISYATQTMHQRRIEKTNDKRDKHIAYNKFLLLEGRKTPLVHKIHHGDEVEFEWNTYVEGTREVLYENLHLFDVEIVKNVLEIDLIEEEAEVMGPEQHHTEQIYYLYSQIKTSIEKDYKNDINKN